VTPEAVPDLPRIYETYHGKVVAYAARLLGRDEADDVAQEVFVKIGRSLGTLADASKLTSWIYAITLNTVRDIARARGSRPDRLPAGLGPAREDGEGESAVSHLPDLRARTPEETVARNEMVACYLDYVRQLPRSYYEVYVLSEFEDLSNEEIARRLSVSVATVKIRLHRARARLYENLRRNCQCYRNHRGELMGEPRRDHSEVRPGPRATVSVRVPPRRRLRDS
jgi:RNA polymerase sigma-70 factor (ECF subfamily)